MPSTLYESVKNSVLQFAQIKKRNERKQDKMIFKWKLITLVLAILLIVLLGVFSQLLQTINNIPEITADKTYIMPLLKQVNTQSVQTLNQTNNLIKGITVASDYEEVYFEWNAATPLFSTQGALNLTSLLTSINNHQQLLFVFSNYFNTTNNTARFGLRAHKGYNENTKNGNNIVVQDDSQTRYSSIFNINTGQSFRYDVTDCHLFTRDATSLTIFESIVITENAGKTQLNLNVTKSACFSAQPLQALAKLVSLTGMDTNPLQNFSGFVLEVYALSLVDQQQYQM